MAEGLAAILGENAPVSSIRLEQIAKHWGSSRALDGITFSADPGSFVVLLAWVYYSAQIFLLGAEYARVYAMRHGSHAQMPVAGHATAVPNRA